MPYTKFAIGCCGCNTKPACGVGIFVALAQRESGSHVQVLTSFGPPVTGTFTLTYSPIGGTPQTTAALNYNCAASDIQTALAALSQIGSGNVMCTGGPFTNSPLTNAPITVNFVGALASVAQPTLTANNSLLFCEQACIRVVAPCPQAPVSFFENVGIKINWGDGSTTTGTMTEQTGPCCPGGQTAAQSATFCQPLPPQGSASITLTSGVWGTVTSTPPSPIVLTGTASGDMAGGPAQITLAPLLGPPGAGLGDIVIAVITSKAAGNQVGQYGTGNPFWLQIGSVTTTVGGVTYNMQAWYRINATAMVFSIVTGGPIDAVGWTVASFSGVSGYAPAGGQLGTPPPIGTFGTPSQAFGSGSVTINVNSVTPVNTGELELIAFADAIPGSPETNAFNALLNGSGGPATNVAADLLYAKYTLKTLTPSGVFAITDNNAAPGPQAIMALPFTLLPKILLPYIGTGETDITMGVPLPPGYGALFNPADPNSLGPVCNCDWLTVGPLGVINTCAPCCGQEPYGLPGTIIGNDGFGDFTLTTSGADLRGNYGGPTITRTSSFVYPHCNKFIPGTPGSPPAGPFCDGTPTAAPITIAVFFSPCGPGTLQVLLSSTQVCTAVDSTTNFSSGCSGSTAVGSNSLQILSCDPFMAMATVQMPGPWNTIYGDTATFTFTAAPPP